MKFKLNVRSRLLLSLMLLGALGLNAQVKFGDNPSNINASSVLELESTSKGFLPPRLTTVQRDAMSNPPAGLVVYNTTMKCFQVNFGTPSTPFWKCLSAITGSPAVTSLNCVGATITGSLIPNTAASGVFITLPYTIGNGMLYNTQLINSTGVTGLTAVLASGVLADSADGNLVFNVVGTPSNSGTATFAIAFGGQSCNVNINLVSPAAVSTLNCAGSILVGSLMSDTAASGVTIIVPYAGGNGGAYSNISIASSGVAGLTATAAAGNVGNGIDSLELAITGTPSSSGNANFALNFGGQTCSLSVPVIPSLNLSGITAGTGSFSGKTCFDIALGNDNTNSCGPLTARTANKADFTQSSTHTQTYTFTPSGTVSNVRFYYINNVGSGVVAISGGNSGNNLSSTVTATVNYDTTNNTLASGLTNSNAMTTTIYAVYNINAVNNNNPSDDRALALTVKIKDCACCVAKIDATTWKEFMCHNLGADNTLDPHTPVVGLQGAYIQWGKRGPNTTGNSAVDWQTAANNGALGFAAAPSTGNANAGSISGWSASYSATTSWGSIKTANDPCPAGYRLPTSTEWNGVLSNNTISRSGSWYSSSTNYGAAVHFGPSSGVKLLTLPIAGYRLNSNGSLDGRGLYGAYWSASYHSSNWAKILWLDATNQGVSYYDMLSGVSVRCVSE